MINKQLSINIEAVVGGAVFVSIVIPKKLFHEANMLWHEIFLNNHSDLSLDLPLKELICLKIMDFLSECTPDCYKKCKNDFIKHKNENPIEDHWFEQDENGCLLTHTLEVVVPEKDWFNFKKRHKELSLGIDIMAYFLVDFIRHNTKE